MRKSSKKIFVSIIGPNTLKCPPPLYDYCVELGQKLVDSNYGIVCGGKGGVMEAVCKGAHISAKYTYGVTVGIIPENDSTYANDYCDIVIPTGFGFARNILVVNSSKSIVAIAGGAGTLSELSFAWQLKKTVFCFTNFDGWSNKLSGKKLDVTGEFPFIKVSSIDDLILKLNEYYENQ